VYCIPSDDAFILAVLSSSVHATWCRYRSGTLETRPRYNSKRTFYPFPLPDASEVCRNELRAAGESLDHFRKKRQEAHPKLTLTQIYNVREALRANRRLSEGEQAILDKGLVVILNEYHDRTDELTLKAYGWPTGLSDRQILQRLVSLNKERALDEKQGFVRWLRPEFQSSRAGVEAARAATAEMQLIVTSDKAEKPLFPQSVVEQAGAVVAALLSSDRSLDAATISTSFKQGRRVEAKIIAILEALVRTGVVSTRDAGRTFQARRAAY
jgi:hypothetical protein